MVKKGNATPTSHIYFSQRLRLHYLDWGNPEAPPLLLVHGHRDHCHNWDWVAEALRDEYHICSCCPPNITRLIASMDMYIYNIYQDSLVVDQYISSELDLSDKEQGLKIIQTSEFPYKGYSEIKILNSNKSLHLP